MKDVLAIDPGLATFGAVVCRTDGVQHECTHAETFTSEPRTDKLGASLAADRVRRTRELAAWFESLLVMFRPCVIAAEGMSFPRGSNPIIMISLAWGVICSMAHERGLEVVFAMPMTWRKSLVKSGREQAAHKIAIQRVPSFRRVARSIPASAQVHARDALGVFVWSTTVPKVRTILRSTR